MSSNILPVPEPLRKNNSLGRAFGHIRTSPLRFFVWGTSIIGSRELYFGDVIPQAKNLLPSRDSLPEPIDIADHWGNVPDSIVCGGVGALIGGACMRLSAAPANVRKAALAGAALLGVVANGISETKFGQRLFDFPDLLATEIPNYAPNTDVVDFAVGSLVAMAAAAAITKGQPHEYLEPLIEHRASAAATTPILSSPAYSTPD